MARIQRIRDAPEVFDFPRDVQPILDSLCVACHAYERIARDGPCDAMQESLKVATVSRQKDVAITTRTN